MKLARGKGIRAAGLFSLALVAKLAGLPTGYAMADDVPVIPSASQTAESSAKQDEKKDEEQVPRVPETVVPGERTPTEGMPESAPSDTGGLSQDPFNSSGAFGVGIEGPFLPDVQGTRINSGKKTENIDLFERPPIIENNYRQLLIKTPSLFLSEESTPLISIGYRGLNPDRNSFMQVLEDGIPIAANIFGFNESYYLPPFPIVDHVEFIHGGSALMYGPQPGGALNFVTKMPVTDRPYSFVAENVGGSHNLFATYEAASGTIGSLGYYVYGVHRDTNGFRDFQSWSDLDYGGAKFVVDLTPCSRLIGHFNAYVEDHGEPGRLTRAAFEADPDQANRHHDYFELQRNFGSLTYQEILDDHTLWELKVWGNDFSRLSRRQRGGGFGTTPTGTDSDLRFEEFKVFGIEPRLRHDYDLLGNCDISTFTAGVLFYYNNGLRHDTRGPLDFGGDVGPEKRIITDRDTSYFSFFAENRFKFGDLSITPGVRLENIRQDVNELLNVSKTAAGEPLGQHQDSDFVPLAGLGIAYDVCCRSQFYGNVSQAYRPKIFQETISPNVGESVAGNLAPGDSWQADVGFRANPTSYFTIDTSLFYLRFKDQTGTIGGVIQNVGDSRHQGWEFATELDLIGLCDAMNGTNNVDQFGSFGVFYNNMILNAEFTAGPAKGNAPQYAPDHLIRGGLTYTYRDPCACDGGYASVYNTDSAALHARDRLNIWLTSTFVGRHFGDDANSSDFFIPSYKVWDLTAEWKVCENFAMLGGIYNLFDERYFGRIVASGIEPADGRNFYVGGRITW